MQARAMFASDRDTSFCSLAIPGVGRQPTRHAGKMAVELPPATALQDAPFVRVPAFLAAVMLVGWPSVQHCGPGLKYASLA